MVDVTNALQPSAQRQYLILSSGGIKEIDATTSRLGRKSGQDQLRGDLFGAEVNDRAVLVLDLLMGLIDHRYFS